MVVVSSAFIAPVEGILLEQPTTKLIVNEQDVGTGTLYITENNVVWGGGLSSQGGMSSTLNLQYQSISLHAIQREPSPALYMVLNYELRLPELGNMATDSGDADDDDDFDPDESPITQLRFVPQNEADLQAMYNAMIQGQSLHPDPQDEVDEDEPYMDGEDFYEGDEEFEDAEETTSQEQTADRLRQLRLEEANGKQNEENEEADISED